HRAGPARRPAVLFLSVRPSAFSARQTVLTLAARPSRPRSSASVASGRARTSARRRSAWAAHPGAGRRGARAATAPVSRRRCFSRRTQDSLTRYFAAAARVPRPASQSASTRSRKSIEYARMAGPPGPGIVLRNPPADRYPPTQTALAPQPPDAEQLHRQLRPPYLRQIRQDFPDRCRELEAVAREARGHGHVRVLRVDVDDEVPVRRERVEA